MQIVDSHQHLWDLDLFQYSWLRSAPSLNRSFRMADYLKATQGLNVVRSVHLEADVDEPWMLAETRHVLGLADRQDSPLQGIVAYSTRSQTISEERRYSSRMSQGWRITGCRSTSAFCPANFRSPLIWLR